LRIRKRAEFLRIQQNSRRVTSAHFVLLVAPQVGPRAPAPARLGLVVTKKVGDAVARNRIKRLCRECFRRSKGLLPDGVDLVVIAKNGADSMTLATVQAEWAAIATPLRKRALETVARSPNSAHASARTATTSPGEPGGARGGPKEPT
jgi:ribonuclease P protein component